MLYCTDAGSYARLVFTLSSGKYQLNGILLLVERDFMDVPLALS